MNIKEEFSKITANVEIQAREESRKTGVKYERVLSTALAMQSIRLFFAYLVGAFSLVGFLSWWLLQ